MDKTGSVLATKEERVLLLETWRDFEKKLGDSSSLKVVLEKMPRRVKKKRALANDDGVCILYYNDSITVCIIIILNYLYIKQSDAGWEEFYDYIFPDEAKAQANLKLLENVKKWKKQKPNPIIDS